MATIFSKIIKGILIGGGTLLSLVCPPVGGAVINAGMAIGSGAIAAGSLINRNGTSTGATIDRVTSTVNGALGNLGLLDPANVTTTSGTNTTGFVLTTPIKLILAAILGFILYTILKRKR